MLSSAARILIKSRLSSVWDFQRMFRLLAFGALAVIVCHVQAQDAAKGQQIAGQVCASCHAADGNSVAAANPKLAGQFPEYLGKQLADFKPQAGKNAARESAIMTPMVANLSADDMKSVAAFYAGQ